MYSCLIPSHMTGAMLMLYGPMLVFIPANRVIVAPDSFLGREASHAQKEENRNSAFVLFCFISVSQVHPTCLYQVLPSSYLHCCSAELEFVVFGCFANICILRRLLSSTACPWCSILCSTWAYAAWQAVYLWINHAALPLCRPQTQQDMLSVTVLSQFFIPMHLHALWYLSTCKTTEFWRSLGLTCVMLHAISVLLTKCLQRETTPT